ncbi:hypothetical protein [Microbacterium sp. NIBRBAC000506063]|uniref:hypothetical protein n=1 Tax=Microbacterium sp. NIBRBAC000506063 TaxID=2734618 RepID=UPI001BB673FA|nr:hypothetical protein [Microbacterium sp. NIBRBAC000506063]QTV79451.1 hypothetical protein KAE78_11145 [Microbacterium sp. NIBRBAC000506063]
MDTPTTAPGRTTWRHWVYTLAAFAILIAVMWALAVLPLAIAMLIAVVVAAALIVGNVALARSAR